MTDFTKYYAYFSIDILTKGIAIITLRLMMCCADEMRIKNVTEPPRGRLLFWDHSTLT